MHEHLASVLTSAFHIARFIFCRCKLSNMLVLHINISFVFSPFSSTPFRTNELCSTQVHANQIVYVHTYVTIAISFPYRATHTFSFKCALLSRERKLLCVHFIGCAK